MRFRIHLLLIVVASLAIAARIACSAAVCAELAPKRGVATASPLGGSSPAALLSLVNGDFVEGTLQDSARRDALCWRSPQFAGPWEFDLAAVASLHFPAPRQHIRTKGEYCIELQGGVRLFGALIAMNDKEVEIDAERFGRLHIDLAKMGRIVRWRNGAELVYSGPNGLAEWHQPKPADAWRQEGNCLATDRADACIDADLRIPPQCTIELEIAWQNNAAFAIAFGAEPPTDQRAFRIERWEDKLTCLWESDAQADLAVLQPATNADGRCHLFINLDQLHHRAAVFSDKGVQLGAVALSGAKSTPASWIRLQNRSGSLRLEQLVIEKADGEPLRQRAGARTCLCRIDGTSLRGDVERFDAEKKQFVFAAKDGPKTQTTRVDAAQVDRIVWPRPNDSPSSDIHVVLRDGVRAAGSLREVKNGRLWIDCLGVKDPIGVPLADVQDLSVSHREQPAKDSRSHVGVLEMQGVRLHGCVADGAMASQPRRLAWRPYGSATTTALLPEASGKIVYRETPQPSSPGGPNDGMAVNRRKPRPAGGAVNWLDVLAANDGGSPTVRVAAGGKKSCNLYLRTGDAIPCDVKRIDDRGVWFESSKYQATFAPHEKVKAVELENASRDIKLSPTKRDRMLTVPRLRRDDPQKNLIRSVDGDYLLANVLAMDEKTVTVEVRLEKRRLPRNKIARILWLHEADGHDRENVSPQHPSSAMRVQSLRTDGKRVTMQFDKMADATLFGTSDALGRCRVDLNEVNQLFFGAISDETTAALPYQRWKLHAAKDPKFAQNNEVDGVESALVGKPAPDFTLQRLDGKPFRLSEQRGKVVVLDFWASWCGPCIQALPQLHHLTDEYKARDVLLIAVNLQESPEVIQATLDRLHVKSVVVLDESGIIARKYAAAAIPQTVIIDRSGRVSRVFVGGGPQYVDHVRDALQKTLADGGNRAGAK